MMRPFNWICLSILLVAFAGCSPAPAIEVTDPSIIDEQDAITPESITAPSFAITLSDAVELTVTQATHEFEAHSEADDTDLIFRDVTSNVVLAINLPGINSIEAGDYTTGADGTAGATLIYEGDGERFTSASVSGPVT